MRFWHAVYRGEDIKPGNAKPITPRHAAFRRLGRGRSDPIRSRLRTFSKGNSNPATASF
jgi:hypothetical protein